LGKKKPVSLFLTSFVNNIAMKQKEQKKTQKKWKILKITKKTLASSAKSMRRFLSGKRMDKALEKAASWGDVKKINRLINAGADINTKDKNGMTPLILAAISTLEGATSEWDEIDHEGATEGATKFLIEHGADINARDNSGRTALMYAGHVGKIDVAKILIENKANIELRDNQGRTAFKLAKMRGNIKILFKECIQ
jgi:ankyrin repeat protein